MYNESDKVLWSENMSAKLFTKEIKKTQQRRTRMRSFETEFAIWINARSVAVQFISVLKTMPVNGRRLHG